MMTTEINPEERKALLARQIAQIVVAGARVESQSDMMAIIYTSD